MQYKLPSFNKQRIHVRKMEEKNQERHESKLQQIESYIGTTKNFSQVERKLDKKRQQQQEDRFTQIEKDNRLLLEKIMNIMHTKNKKDELSIRPKSLNIGRRRKDQENIIKENLMLLKRISQRKSDYSKDKIDRQWKQNEKYQELLGGCTYNPQTTQKKYKHKRGTSQGSNQNASFGF